ncbi:MAG: efflux RND transporter periplasmic adaptor subunit [Acidiferrobacter sp.]
MFSFRRRAALAVLGAFLAACSRHDTPATGAPVVVDVGYPVATQVAKMRSAVGDIEPGASPVVIAPRAAVVREIAVRTGSAVARGQIVATLRPTGTRQNPPKPLAIRVPVAATVTRVFVSVGERVRGGQRLFALGGASIRTARAPFPASLQTILHEGQRVFVHSPLAPRTPLKATIIRLTHPKKGNAIYAWIDLPPRRGFPVGSPLRVDVVTATHTRLVIPRSAVSLRSPGAVVFVVRKGKVLERRITTAQTLPQGVVVRAGLRAQSEIVTHAQTRLTSGMRVHVERPQGP